MIINESIIRRDFRWKLNHAGIKVYITDVPRPIDKNSPSYYSGTEHDTEGEKTRYTHIQHENGTRPW